MMMSTMTLSPPSHAIKARANSSDGYYGSNDNADSRQLDFDYSLQHAVSSEAQLPSYHNNHGNLLNMHYSGSLSISSNNDSYNSSDTSHENHYAPRHDDSYNSGTSQHENNYHYNTLQHHDSFNHSSTKPQQPLPAAAQIARAKSDSTHNDSSTTTRSRLLQTTPTPHSGTNRWHTIKSGITPADSVAQQDPTVGGAVSSPPKQHNSMIQPQQNSPLCQTHHPVNLETISPHQKTNKSP